MYSARVRLVLASAARSLPKTQHGVRFGFCKMRRAACIRKKPNYGEIIEKLAFHWVWNERQQHNTRQAAVRVVVQSAQGVLHRPRKLSRKGNPGPPVCGFALKMSACRELQLACTARPLSAWSLFLHCCQGKKKTRTMRTPRASCSYSAPTSHLSSENVRRAYTGYRVQHGCRKHALTFHHNPCGLS